MKPHHHHDACTELAITAGAVARDMRQPCARSLAASKAVAIGKSWHELHNTRHADLVRRARTFLRALPGYTDDLLDQAASDARHFSDALYAAAADARRRERLRAGLRQTNHERAA